MIAEFGLPMALLMAVLLRGHGGVTLAEPATSAGDRGRTAFGPRMALTSGRGHFHLTTAIVLGVAWRHILLARNHGLDAVARDRRSRTVQVLGFQVRRDPMVEAATLGPSGSIWLRRGGVTSEV